ncbi:hypothetical protein LAZ67_1006709 [Cordylochernes scorpioides]|uniref:Transposase n=1 Tax=Cordylochernes scorpioides TaxID=51811 RepID=A0ABY6JYQ6_9ARAC|nr:hypothetical protein LAZ67_1006709 [Cordylochernes scorpioides]
MLASVVASRIPSSPGRGLSHVGEDSLGDCTFIDKKPRKCTQNQVTDQRKPKNNYQRAIRRHYNSDPHWLKNVITGDETWLYGYDPEIKRQSSQRLEPGEPRFKKQG